MREVSGQGDAASWATGGAGVGMCGGCELPFRVGQVLEITESVVAALT